MTDRPTIRREPGHRTLPLCPFDRFEFAPFSFPARDDTYQSWPEANDTYPELMNRVHRQPRPFRPNRGRIPK